LQAGQDIKLTVIVGSLRADSTNAVLASTLPSLAPSHCTFVRAPSIADVPHYDGDLESGSGIPAAIMSLAELIRSSAGVIIVSPEYNYSIPGVLKNALDWLSRAQPAPLANKPVLIQSVSAGVYGGMRMQHHLRQVLVALGARTLAKPEIAIGMATSKFDKDRQLVDLATRDAVKAQLAAFVLECEQQAVVR
jgi:chromate reductase